jgi:hypothetical protein
MEFALSENNERIRATPHATGVCSICKESMIPKCGQIKVHHWAHKSKKNCDAWWEPESEWHRQWKTFVQDDFREIVIEKNGVKHRADIKLPSGIIIELQKSPLVYGERLNREVFYEKLVWIIFFPSDRIVTIENVNKKVDCYIKVKKINEWVYQFPHLSPIFLDFDDGMVFRIIEIGNKKGLTRWLHGVILEKTEFVKQYFDDKKSVLDLDKDRVGCLDQLKFSHYHRVYVKQEKRV